MGHRGETDRSDRVERQRARATFLVTLAGHRTQDVDDERPFERGELVRHGKYGIGKIVAMEAVGAQQRLTVYFESKGRVKLVPQYARLERLS